MASRAGLDWVVKRLARTALLEVSAEVAYAVVAEVARYPEFLPGCESVTVLETTPAGLVAEVGVVGKGIRESFVTANVHRPPESITMSLQSGPFECLEGKWVFTSIGEIGCKIELQVEYLPKGMVARLLSGLADHVANQLVDAFVARINQQYMQAQGG